jgi:SAM-dependent methyltransferase
VIEHDAVVATRAAYDTVAGDYAELLADELAAKPLDRALLHTFAELARAASAGDGDPTRAPTVLDAGCGPGRIAAHLHGLGLEVRGVDLSAEMVAEARRRHPGIRFDQGTLTDLPLSDGAMAGLVAWYSIIHTLPDHQPAVFAELARVLAPGGEAIVTFQVGDDDVAHLTHAYGHAIELDVHRLSPERVVDDLAAAGLATHICVRREPTAPERTPHAYLLARRTAAGTRRSTGAATADRRACGS